MVNCFASPNLGVLKEYICQYNQRMRVEIRLVDTFINCNVLSLLHVINP